MRLIFLPFKILLSMLFSVAGFIAGILLLFWVVLSIGFTSANDFYFNSAKGFRRLKIHTSRLYHFIERETKNVGQKKAKIHK
ncbi:MAG: hypothetical protein DRQ88_06105 [Epsilonproteobacteria bacterium]|nr:MAG: hypothetical protein DRQ88_06105 [Campylobacterota bacterium]